MIYAYYFSNNLVYAGRFFRMRYKMSNYILKNYEYICSHDVYFSYWDASNVQGFFNI